MGQGLFLDKNLPFEEIPHRKCSSYGLAQNSSISYRLKEEQEFLFHQDRQALEEASLIL